MNSTARNILAVVAGIAIGTVVNMGIIMISGSIIPPPEGVDVNDMESIKENIHLYTPIQFLFPFLAHSIGTLFGAVVAALIAANNKMKFGLAIGFFFLLGGITAAYIFPAPNWFIMLDLVIAYIPMGWLGAKIILRNT